MSACSGSYGNCLLYLVGIFLREGVSVAVAGYFLLFISTISLVTYANVYCYIFCCHTLHADGVLSHPVSKEGNTESVSAASSKKYPATATNTPSSKSK